MDHFTAHRLRFLTQVQTTVELNEHQGSAIRGALFHALRRRFCGLARGPREPSLRPGGRAGAGPDCAACPLVATCPVATLVSTLRPGSARGRDVPRPYTVQPPLATDDRRQGESEDRPGVCRYAPGMHLEFGISLFAQAVDLFPYIILAMNEFEEGGIGRRVIGEDGRWARGTLSVEEAWAENPLTGAWASLRRPGETLVRVPDIGLTHEQVLAVPVPPARTSVTVRFLTPTRLVQRARLLKPDDFCFQTLFQRLLERLEALSQQFSDTPLRLLDPVSTIAAAGRVRLEHNDLRWEEVWSYSTRRATASPIGGLVGTATFVADDWAPFWPWLVWGQFTHVGKDAVKGNGWYRVEA
jgi:hypothetical protein